MTQTEMPFNVAPRDEYNNALLLNVHPEDWQNPEPGGAYNLVVIGAGTAGLITASAAAGLGARVALIERHLMGGDCLNVGCVPSKSLLRSAKAVREVREGESFGVFLKDGYSVDFAEIMARMRRIRAEISVHDSVRRYQELGVDVFLGDAVFLSGREIAVGGKRLKFKKAVIATGARALEPAIKGLSQIEYYTNESIFNLTELPERLGVIGAGPIGCEMAQAFARFGSRVTILDKGTHLLAREDEDAAGLLQEQFVADGIALSLETAIRRVEETPEGKVIHYARAGSEDSLSVDAVLIGVGRAPNVEGMGLEKAGVAYDKRRGVSVNEKLQTSNPRIFACGDVCLRHKFTHAAEASAKIVIQNALFFGKKRVSDLIIPWCTYTDPEIAHVGMNERELQAKGIEYETYRQSFSGVDRAIADGQEKGLAKVTVLKGTDRILGATLVGAHAGEMIGEVTLAMAEGVGLKGLADLIHPYPTQAEAIKKVAYAYNRTRLKPWVQKILEAFFKLRR